MNAPRPSSAYVLLVFVLMTSTVALATQAPETTARFSRLILNDPSRAVQPQTLPLDLLSPEDPLRGEWKAFVADHDAGWRVHLDGRSAAPLWVEGHGIPWIAGSGNSLKDGSPVTLESLEKSLRSFMAGRPQLFKTEDAELVLDREASGNPTPELWQIVFKRQVGGVPVAGDRYLFYIGHGNLIAFGASRWTPIAGTMMPVVNATGALAILNRYMGLNAGDKVSALDSGSLVLVPMAADKAPRRPYQGPPGNGYVVALAWRQVVRVEGLAGTWVGLVDARNGKVLAFYDDDMYSTVKGGVYPESPEGVCPAGCEQAGYPMPFSNVTMGHKRQTTNGAGSFQCTPSGGIATVTLSGPFVLTYDECGPISESVTCENDLDLGVSSGTDCAVPPGASLGNTHAARTSYYHLNRIIEKARWYLPTLSWLSRQFEIEVNYSSDCGTYYSPFYDTAKYARSGGGCGNAGEIPGVVRHEWGHGLDNNDGGGMDNPSEAYADITEFLEDHNSCFAGNYHPGQQCPDFGNPCLDCTGLRDLDWDKHSAHTPSTPMGFVVNNCPAGNAPCGYQVHCEGHLLGESLWDLATRDLPAAGLDQATAWQLVQRIWFTSRLGSSGNAYNCTLPNSDSCSAGSWFNRLRVFDDDDGNLGNGTLHAAAIYQAFSRHAIACGAATDPSNQSTTSCPSIGTPALEANGGSGSIALSWTPVQGGTSYLVLRNEFGCSYSFLPVASLPGTSYTDTGLAGLTYYYRVQAVGTNSACDGPVSACRSAQVICLDADGDGSGSPGSPSCARGSRADCDDSNAAVYPGAPQLCDGLNNDCSNPAWPAVPANEADSDGDGHRICAGDCNDANMAVWAIPEEAENLLLSTLQGLTWSPPTAPGGTTLLYDTIRSTVASDFVTGATCIETDDGSDLTANDPETPAIGQAFFYIVRGGNSCGEGSLGRMSSGEERTARSCP